MLDDSDCDFGENYELPDEFSAVVTIKTVTRYVKNKKIVTNYVYRTGRFPFRTTLKKLKMSKRGFTASGTRTQGTKILSETVKVSKEDGYLTATNIMKITEAGIRCQYSFSGDASQVSN